MCLIHATLCAPTPDVCSVRCCHLISHASKSLTHFWISYHQVGMNCSREQHISYQLMGSGMSVEGKISTEVPILYRTGTDFLKYTVKLLILKSFFFNTIAKLLHSHKFFWHFGRYECSLPYHTLSHLPKFFLLYVFGESLHHLHHESL
jgi:hypothetical protein